ncbi:MAG TPA: DUF362 domain-containing protein [Candidatus Kapabacteria bacterium]|nr:DUF362 domain-containing protein [Candidatus Kapabacteria bacterium]
MSGNMDRRKFLKITGGAGSALGAGMVLGTPALWSQDTKNGTPPVKPSTNIDEALKVPRTPYSLPGFFPGRVVEINDPQAMTEKGVAADVVKNMIEKGITSLTGKTMAESFALFFKPTDVVGIKVNPVGAGLISTRLEVVDAVIAWLRQGGMPAKNIIIWDRFDYMLKDAGFTPERYPGIGIIGLQTMDEAFAEGKTKDSSQWLDKEGNHISYCNFDKDNYYFADVDGPQDQAYLCQHVVNGKYSYFGKLLTQTLTKIINIPVFKNTGNGISMATKNMGYGAICNTGRLHRPIFFDVCTEVLAFPVIRDKMVLNITDGLRGQYDGGPEPNAQFTYFYNTLFFATDPFALDMTCHNILVNKRREMNVKSFNEHPRFSEYLRYAEKLGLGIADPQKIKHVKA